MKAKLFYIIILIISTTFLSCEKYLDAKSDRKLVVPSTLQDLNALLDNAFNNTYSLNGEVSADNFYHTEAIWNAISNERDRDIYTWENNSDDGDGGAWSGRYQIILTMNVVLNELQNINPKSHEQEEWNRIKGTALFFRGYSLSETAQLYSLPYEATIANEALGIPLKLSPDINSKTERSTMAETYGRIIEDLTLSVKLLPIKSSIATRPNKVAAYGQLARVYMYMRDYKNAGIYADSALQLYSELLDYNAISLTASIPFARFNKEVIFHAYSSSTNLTLARCKVDSVLYDSYKTADLRKTLFFSKNTDQKSYAFKGTYDGNTANSFTGITTAELYLIRAEAFAREDQVSLAMNDLNTLMEKRMAKPFNPISAIKPKEALNAILTERRKELIFRGQRWNDLRRLNKDSNMSKTLVRILGAKTYTLPPNDKRYAFPIPEDVIQLSGIPQNER